MSHAARYLVLRVLVGACGKQSVHHLHVSITGGKHRGSPTVLKARPRTTRQHSCWLQHLHVNTPLHAYTHPRNHLRPCAPTHAYPRTDTRSSHTPTCPSSLTHTPLHCIHLRPDVARSPVPWLARPCRRLRQAVCPPPPRVHCERQASWQSNRPEGTTTHHKSA